MTDRSLHSREGTGVDIDLVNLDLALVSNIVLDSMGQIIPDSLLFYIEVGDNMSGFETVLLNNNAADGEYFSAIIYTEGLSSVNYKLTINAVNYGSGEFTESFTAAEEGFAIIVGPFIKTGSTFSRVAGGTIATFKYRMDASRFNSSKSPH